MISKITLHTVLTLILSVWHIHLGLAQEEEEFSELNQLKGSVYMVTQTVHQVKGFLKDSSIIVGKVIPGEENMNVYFDKKNRLSYISFYPEDEDADSLKIIYSYNKNNLCTARAISLKTVGTLREVTYHYMPRSKKLHTKTYIEEGEKMEEWRYSYNKNGQNHQIKIYEYLGSKASLSQIHSMFYDKKGLKIQEKKKMIASQKIHKYQFVYGPQGMKTKEIWFDQKGKVSDVWKYSYTNRNISKEIWTGPNKKEEINLYRYDKMNHLTAHIFKSRYSPQVIKKFFKYLYDKNENWTQKIFLHFNSKKKLYVFDKVVLRKIIYHP